MKAITNPFFLIASALISATFAINTMAGGRLEIISPEFPLTSSGTEFGNVDIVPIRWDERCLPVHFVLDSDTLPNAGTDLEIDLETYQRAIELAMQEWTDVPTSYIAPKIGDVRPLADAPLNQFDFISPITFGDFGGATSTLAAAPTITATTDTEVVPGEDIDGDGDIDVFDPAVAGTDQCFDFDGDGDIELSAGLYKAGTIIEAEIRFNTNPMWVTSPEDARATPAFAEPNFLDLTAFATHEVGHTLGMAHSMITKSSDTDGSDPTMHPFLSPSSTNAAAIRTLSADDKAWISYIYPEGSKDTGPAALQPGDIAFDRFYALIGGTASISATEPSTGLGAHVVAESRSSSNPVVIGGYTGDNPATFGVFSEGDLSILAPSFGDITIEQTRYRIPVPKRQSYSLQIESVDGLPVPATSVNFTAEIGTSSGTSFNDDLPKTFFSGAFLDELELQTDKPILLPDIARPVWPGRGPFNFLLPRVERVGPVTGSTGASLIPSFSIQTRWVARRFSRDDVLAQLDSGRPMLAARALTLTAVDDNLAALRDSTLEFGQAVLATGVENEDGTISLRKVVTLAKSFKGEDRDYSYLRLSPGSNRIVDFFLKTISPESDLFLAIEQIPSTASDGVERVSRVAAAFTLSDSGTFMSESFDAPFEAGSTSALMDLEFLLPPEE